MSFKEAKRTFLTPECSQDIFHLHVSSSWGQMKQYIKNEAHKMPGSIPSPPCPLRNLRGRFYTTGPYILVDLSRACYYMHMFPPVTIGEYQYEVCHNKTQT